MSELVREDPPARSKLSLSIKYADELAKVKTEPGEWFRLGKQCSSTQYAASVRSKLMAQTEGFEFTTSNRHVYVRYVGEES